MRKLTYYVGATLDGFIAGPDHSYDFLSPGDDVVAHIVSDYPETLPTHVRAALGIAPGNQRFDTVVMGRGTYDPALQVGITSPYAHLRQLVFSRSLPSTDAAVEIVAGDPVARIRELKAEAGKDIWLAGGGQLAGQLLAEIDELVVKIYPAVAVTGIPMFAGGFRPTHLELVGSRVFESGAIFLSYARRGEGGTAERAG